MPFPSRYMVIYVSLPQDRPSQSELYGASIHWFGIDNDILPGFDANLFVFGKLWSWLDNFVPIMASPQAAKISASVYVRPVTILNPMIAIQSNISIPIRPALPHAVNGCIRRFTNGPFEQPQGRFRVGPVREDQVSGNHLTNAALSTWQTAADAIVAPFTVSGVTFTPSVASYRYSTLTAITSAVAMPDLRIVKRRMRIRYSVAGQPFTVPYPPPP